MKILAVDDEPDNLQMIASLLKKTPYQFYLAESAAEGLAILQREGCQIALVDWMMPDVDGLTLVRQIRESAATDYVYVIMITALGNTENMLKALESGVDDFVGRPFSLRELRARIQIGERILGVQNALKHRQQEWEATADAMPQLVCLLDRNGCLLRANSKLELWGLALREEAHGAPLHTLLANVYPSLGAQFHDNWSQIEVQLANGQEYEFTSEDSTLKRFFTLHFEPIEHQPNATQHSASFAVVSITDITHRRKLEIALKAEHEKSESLLLNILPKVISSRLKAHEPVIADEFESATVLFTDMVGFTSFAADVPPRMLVMLLNDIFSRFDQATRKYGLEKIKTIGDAYMVAAGVPIPREDHAEATVALGLEMIAIMDEFNQAHTLDLGLRVGVHSGLVTAGVIGTQKFAYDLWGATVNIASRLESTGVQGHIHLSSQTAETLGAVYQPIPRNPIELKGIGLMQTYLLAPKSPQS